MTMGKIRFFLLTKSLGLYINVLSWVAPGRSRALSYRLFSSPRYGKLSPVDLPKVLETAHKEEFHLSGSRIQSYRWPGVENGKTVLLVHGWESNAARWELLLPFLERSGYHIVAFDAPAHGLSEGPFSVPRYADAIHEAAQRYRPQFVIGHSIGGSAVLFYQYKYRNAALEKVVVLGSPADFDIVTDNFIALLSLSVRSKALFESYFSEHFSYHPKDFTARVFASGMSMPGLIAHDEDDEVVRFPESGKIAGAWSHARFVRTKGLGHSMHDDRLYEEVRAFLQD